MNRTLMGVSERTDLNASLVTDEDSINEVEIPELHELSKMRVACKGCPSIQYIEELVIIYGQILPQIASSVIYHPSEIPSFL